MANELFAKFQKKVVPFEQSGQFYHKKAKKHMENNNYITALSFYRKAVEKDPQNWEYMMDLAEVFTEMSYFEESNQILFSILQKEKLKKGDCYFGLGCNFLGLQEYRKAIECFEKYLDIEPEGIYSEDAQDLLEILRNQEYFMDDSYMLDPNKERLYKIAGRGKELLDRGEYKKAIKHLEVVVKKDPAILFAKNNLALAYFCVGNLDRAIDLSLEVLNDQPENVHANCNIALFLHEKGEKEASRSYLNTILEYESEDPEELHKIAVTLCELKEHEKANMVLKKLLKFKPYDIRILHYTAVSCFNTGRYKEAFLYWSKVGRIAPHNTISDFYKRMVYSYLKENKESRALPYHFQVPYDEIIRRIKKINDMLKMPSSELKEKWQRGEGLRSLLNWGLDLNDKTIKKAILNVIASFQDDKSEAFLREFLLRKNEDEEVKKEALGLLKQMNAMEPYIAYVSGDIVEVKVNILDEEHVKIPEVFERIVDIAVYKMKGRYEGEYEFEIRELWQEYIESVYPHGFPRINKCEAWAAALELYYCACKGINVSKAMIARHYGISSKTLNKNYKILKEILEKE